MKLFMYDIRIDIISLSNDFGNDKKFSPNHNENFNLRFVITDIWLITSSGTFTHDVTFDIVMEILSYAAKFILDLLVLFDKPGIMQSFLIKCNL